MVLGARYSNMLFKNFAVISRKYSTSRNLVDVNVNEKTGVALVTMQRKPVNSLNLELISELTAVLDRLESEKARGVILTSASTSVFSSGLDIMEMYKPNMERVKNFWINLQDFWMKLYGSSFPTVAAINGHSPAGGCLLAMSCEYRVMVNNFTIGLNETQLGIVAPSWFIATMKNTISTREMEMALTTGRLYKTEEALNVGLVDEIATDKAEAIAKSEAFLKRFSKIPPVARAMTKLNIRGATIRDLQDNREQDLNIFMGFVTQAKVQKGLEVYLEALKQKS